jgi:outer membrane lipoprotein
MRRNPARSKLAVIRDTLFKNIVMRVHFFIVIAATAVLSACAGRPLVDLAQVDVNLSPQQLTESDPAPMGTVNWGGRIIELRSVGESSEFEILSYPPDSSGRPDTQRASDGRFIAVLQGFVDPLVYDEGRTVTIVGRIDGYRDGTVGEQAFRWPVVSVIEIAPAPERPRERVTPMFSIGVGFGF